MPMVVSVQSSFFLNFCYNFAPLFIFFFFFGGVTFLPFIYLFIYLLKFCSNLIFYDRRDFASECTSDQKTFLAYVSLGKKVVLYCFVLYCIVLYCIVVA